MEPSLLSVRARRLVLLAVAVLAVLGLVHAGVTAARLAHDTPLDVTLHVLSWLTAGMAVLASFVWAGSRWGLSGLSAAAAVAWVVLPFLHAGALHVLEGTERGGSAFHLLPVVAPVLDVLATISSAAWPFAAFGVAALGVAALVKARRPVAGGILGVIAGAVSLTWGERVASFLLD